MSEKPKFTIVPKEKDAVRVEEIGITGNNEVFRPDIAAQVLGTMSTAAENAGIEMVIPDDISSLFSREIRGLDGEEQS